GPHPSDVARAGLHPYEVVAEIVQELLRAGGAGLPDGHHPHHGRDADGDPDRGERAPRLVPEERSPGLTAEGERGGSTMQEDIPSRVYRERQPGHNGAAAPP